MQLDLLREKSNVSIYIPFSTRSLWYYVCVLCLTLCLLIENSAVKAFLKSFNSLYLEKYLLQDRFLWHWTDFDDTWHIWHGTFAYNYSSASSYWYENNGGVAQEMFTNVNMDSSTVGD